MGQTLPRGILIAIEGIDGAGKTTQAKWLATNLRASGLDVTTSKEPTKGPWGQKIRESKTTERMSPEMELQAFLNDRRQHVAELIDPGIARGEVIIIDRYFYSTVAYQGARGMNPAELIHRNEEFAPRPDLLVILDVPPRTGLERIHQRGDSHDLFEDEDNLTKARKIFNNLDGDHILRVDARMEIHQIFLDILNRLYEGPLRDWILKSQRHLYSWVKPAAEPSPELQDALARAEALVNDPSIPVDEKAETFLSFMRGVD